MIHIVLFLFCHHQATNESTRMEYTRLLESLEEFNTRLSARYEQLNKFKTTLEDTKRRDNTTAPAAS